MPFSSVIARLGGLLVSIWTAAFRLVGCMVRRSSGVDDLSSSGGVGQCLRNGLLSPAVAAVGVPEHAQFGTCVWNMRALLVCDERWTGA